MPFPPQDKTMEGLLKNTEQRITLLERRLAGGGSTTPGGSPATIHPIGDVWEVSDGVAPTGTLLCDGRAVSRTTYAALFAKIGTKYGRGDNSTTFNLPNLNGRELFVPNSAPLARWNMSNVFVPLSQAEGNEAVADTYEIRAMMTVANSGAPLPRMRFSTGGADAVGNSYVFARSWVNNAALNRASDQATSIYLSPEAAARLTLQAIVSHANIADYTEFTWDITGRNSATSPFLMTGLGAYQANEAHDGITLYSDAGPMFGYLQVIPFGGSMVPSVIATNTITSGGGGGSSVNMTRGTTAQRDAVHGVPTTDAAKAALANQVIEWFNTDKGWTEVYYATTGTAGLTVKGVIAGNPSGWYPTSSGVIFGHRGMAGGFVAIPGSPTELSFAAAQHLVGGVLSSGASGMTVPIGGRYRISATHYSSGGIVDHAATQIRWQISTTLLGITVSKPTNSDVTVGSSQVRNLTAGGILSYWGYASGSVSLYGTDGYNGCYHEVEYLGPPLANG